MSERRKKDKRMSVYWLVHHQSSCCFLNSDIYIMCIYIYILCMYIVHAALYFGALEYTAHTVASSFGRRCSYDEYNVY